MLLSLSYTAENATDLGYLLHKNPARSQAFSLNFGKAYVFYPEADGNRCTACLLLDINPLDLARGKEGARGEGLFEYVSDRPYVSSSFMSTAIARVYGTAMSGRCEKRQALADEYLSLEASLSMLPCRGETAWLERVFGPLGYSVTFTPCLLDETFPGWGESRYVDLTLRGTVRLRDLLNHLYVLIPVFDRQKHYWMTADEVDKLLRHGQGWLENHPEKQFITDRYFTRNKGFTRAALNRMALDTLDDGGTPGMVQGEAEEIPHPPKLNDLRLAAVCDALRESGAQSVIDLGCGEGNLLRLLLKENGFTRIAGTDVSPSNLERAAVRLRLEKLPETQRKRITLFQSSLTYRDARFAEYDAAAVVEVIEHLDKARLAAFEAVLFREARPATVVLSTPNREYNLRYSSLTAEGLRHGDHRFEFTRGEFREWGDAVAARFGYRTRYTEIGETDPDHGQPTLMGVFTRCE